MVDDGGDARGHGDGEYNYTVILIAASVTINANKHHSSFVTILMLTTS